MYIELNRYYVQRLCLDMFPKSLIVNFQFYNGWVVALVTQQYIYKNITLRSDKN